MQFSSFQTKVGIVGQEGIERELEKLCRVLPPALMAAIPVGASTTNFFLVIWHTCFRKVDLPVPAFPVRKTTGGCIVSALKHFGTLRCRYLSVYMP